MENNKKIKISKKELNMLNEQELDKLKNLAKALLDVQDAVSEKKVRSEEGSAALLRRAAGASN